jgi:hypothetical protein
MTREYDQKDQKEAGKEKRTRKPLQLRFQSFCFPRDFARHMAQEWLGIFHRHLVRREVE